MPDLNVIVILQWLLVVVLALPLVGAVGTVCLGRRSANGARGVAYGFAFLHLGLTAILVGLTSFGLTSRGDNHDFNITMSASSAFRPMAVPGDPGHAGVDSSETSTTGWALLRLAPPQEHAPPSDVQFYIGLDGLNVWLIGLTSLMTFIAVLISLGSIKDKPGAYYAWLFVLETAVIGAFAAFDVVLFYVFFELTLIPTFFLIGNWGVGGGKRDAARKFFLYTLFGSLFTLAGLIGIVLTNPTPLNERSNRVMHKIEVDPATTVAMPKAGPVTFSIPVLMQNVAAWGTIKEVQVGIAVRKINLAKDKLFVATQQATSAPQDANLKLAVEQAEAELTTMTAGRAAAEADRAGYLRVQMWLFFAVMCGFMVKVPIVPFHTWLPSAYNEAPIAVTMLLSALLAKLGTYGVLRIVLPLCPDAAVLYGLPVFGTLGAVSIVYAAFCAYAQRDMKLLTAYSSVSHLGLLVIGLFTFNREGLSGAALHMVNHGLATGAMFALLGFLYQRYRTLDMNQYGGLMGRFPGYTFLMFVICLASVGLPGLNNFVSEMLMLAGLFELSNAKGFGWVLTVAAASGILLSAWYTFTMLRRVFFGPLHEPQTATPVAPMTGNERVAFVIPAVLCLILGLFPHVILETIKGDINTLAQTADYARDRAGVPLSAPPQRFVVNPVVGNAPVGGGAQGKAGPRQGAAKGPPNIALPK